MNTYIAVMFTSYYSMLSRIYIVCYDVCYTELLYFLLIKAEDWSTVFRQEAEEEKSIETFSSPLNGSPISSHWLAFVPLFLHPNESNFFHSIFLKLDLFMVSNTALPSMCFPAFVLYQRPLIVPHDAYSYRREQTQVLLS